MEIPMYKDLVELYNKGLLQKPEGGRLYYYLTEERKLLGQNYVHIDSWDNFISTIHPEKELRKNFEARLLWG